MCGRGYSGSDHEFGHSKRNPGFRPRSRIPNSRIRRLQQMKALSLPLPDVLSEVLGIWVCSDGLKTHGDFSLIGSNSALTELVTGRASKMSRPSCQITQKCHSSNVGVSHPRGASVGCQIGPVRIWPADKLYLADTFPSSCGFAACCWV